MLRIETRVSQCCTLRSPAPEMISHLYACIWLQQSQKESREDCGPLSKPGKAFPRIIGAALPRLIAAVAQSEEGRMRAAKVRLYLPFGATRF